jgi:uncharacterized membrane protein (DUF485 family)
MLHEPASQSGPDPASAYKTSLGVKLFIVYCLIDGGFVFAATWNEGHAMETVVFAGLNLAVVYGLGLIVIALVMALIYNAMCNAKERSLQAGQGGEA